MPAETAPERRPTLTEIIDSLIVDLYETRDYVLEEQAGFDIAQQQLRRLLEEALSSVNDADQIDDPYKAEDAIREAEGLLGSDPTEL